MLRDENDDFNNKDLLKLTLIICSYNNDTKITYTLRGFLNIMYTLGLTEHNYTEKTEEFFNNDNKV